MVPRPLLSDNPKHFYQFLEKLAKTAVSRHLDEISPRPPLFSNLFDHANSFSTLLWTHGQTMESLMTLATKGIECIKNRFEQFKIFSIFSKKNGGDATRQPSLDFFLGLGKYRGKFGNASYYRGWMQNERTNRQTLLFIYIDIDSDRNKRDYCMLYRELHDWLMLHGLDRICV